MKGIKKVKVSTRRIVYEFELKRRITILSGDSATGKSTLIDLIDDAVKSNNKTTRLECDCKCKVLSHSDWELILRNTHETIVFIEEDFEPLKSDLFAEIVKNSSNYYVIALRDSIPSLAYSYKDIYEVHTSGKYHILRPRYNIKDRKADAGTIVMEDLN